MNAAEIQSTKRLKEIKDAGGNGFITDAGIYLTRCPKCKKENYVMNVSSGICTWCGYDSKTSPLATSQTPDSPR